MKLTVLFHPFARLLSVKKWPHQPVDAKMVVDNEDDEKNDVESKLELYSSAVS